MRGQSWLAIAQILVLAGALSPALGEDEISEDERFWTADSSMSALVDSLGRGTVEAEVRAILGKAARSATDPDQDLTYAQVDRWIEAVRWAVLLEDESTLPALETLAAVPWRENISDVHHRLTYFPRCAIYRLTTRSQGLADRARYLAGRLNAENPDERTFAEEELVRLGTGALPVLIEHAREVIIPNLEAMPEEPFSTAEMQPEFDYLNFTTLLRAMVATSEDQALFQALRSDPNPLIRRLVEDVLD
jgi:hypothetical protein